MKLQLILTAVWVLYQHPLLPFQVRRRTYGGHETHEKCERPSLEPVFGSSILGYCRNIVVQYGRLCGRGPTPYVDMKGSF